VKELHDSFIYPNYVKLPIINGKRVGDAVKNPGEEFFIVSTPSYPLICASLYLKAMNILDYGSTDQRSLQLEKERCRGSACYFTWQ